MTGFKQAFLLGILLSSAAIHNSYGERFSPPDAFRRAAGTYSVEILFFTTYFTNGTYQKERYKSKAQIRVPYRRGRITLSADVGSSPIFLEGRIEKVRFQKGRFGVGGILRHMGRATIRSGPAPLVGVHGRCSVSAFSYRRGTFPFGVFSFRNHYGDYLFIELKHPNLNRAYARADREVAKIYAERATNGEQAPEIDAPRNIRN